MKKPNQTVLLEDYRSTLIMLQHEDMRRDSMFRTFLYVNAAFYSVASFILTRPTLSEGNMRIVISTAVIVAALNVIFFILLERLRIFARLRNFHMREIEHNLGFTGQQTREKLFRQSGYLENSVAGGSVDKLTIPRRASLSASLTESMSPLIAAGASVAVAIWLWNGGQL